MNFERLNLSEPTTFDSPFYHLKVCSTFYYKNHVCFSPVLMPLSIQLSMHLYCPIIVCYHSTFILYSSLISWICHSIAYKLVSEIFFYNSPTVVSNVLRYRVSLTEETIKKSKIGLFGKKLYSRFPYLLYFLDSYIRTGYPKTKVKSFLWAKFIISFKEFFRDVVNVCVDAMKGNAFAIEYTYLEKLPFWSLSSIFKCYIPALKYWKWSISMKSPAARALKDLSNR